MSGFLMSDGVEVFPPCPVVIRTAWDLNPDTVALLCVVRELWAYVDRRYEYDMWQVLASGWCRLYGEPFVVDVGCPELGLVPYEFYRYMEAEANKWMEYERDICFICQFPGVFDRRVLPALPKIMGDLFSRMTADQWRVLVAAVLVRTLGSSASVLLDALAALLSALRTVTAPTHAGWGVLS